MRTSTPEISVVVPAYNEADNLPLLHERLTAVLSKEHISGYELLFVNDGSNDETLDVLKGLAKIDIHVKYLSFSRNFGHQAAIRAGLTHSRGQGVITMDADLQQPPELLPDLIKRWKEGHEIVHTKRLNAADTGLFKRFTSDAFYKFCIFLMGMKLERGAADFRLLDRQVVAVVNAIRERRLFMRAFVVWAGYRSTTVEYTAAARHSGSSKYSLAKMRGMALDGITQFSIRPLRLVNLLGVFTITIALIYAIYATWVRFGTHHTVQGWTSLMIVVILLFGVQFLVLGIMGEYVGRTFLLTKDWPDYIISESTVDIDDPIT